MRKLFGFIFVILLISCEKPPKDSVTLQIKYIPEKVYNYSSEQTLQTVITYTGKQKILKELKRRGHQNPTILNKKSTTNATIKTGKPEDENTRFPVKVDYISSITVNGKKEAPVNATFHGKCLMDSIPYFDLAVADALDRQSKLILLESWNKSFSQLAFTGQKLKIGEEFSTQNPVSIPMEGSEIDMIVNAKYKLVSINGNIANLELSQEYTLNPRLMDNSFHGSVKGQGSLIYDMEQSIVLNYTLDTDMELTKKLDSFEFHLKTKSRQIQKTSLAQKNK